MLSAFGLFLTPPLVAYSFRRKSKLLSLAILITWLNSLCPIVTTILITVTQPQNTNMIQAATLDHKTDASLPYLTSNYRQIGSLHGIGTSWQGLDYAAPCGTKLVAPITGTVTSKGVDSYCGQWGCNNTFIVMRGDNGQEVLMMHGDYLVPVGTRIYQGKTHIGNEASNGNSSMCHTHFTIR